MEVLSSRVLLRPVDLARSTAFYRDTLGLAIYREFGEDPWRGTVFFLGGGFLEVSGRSPEPAGPNVQLWLQVRDVDRAHEELSAAGVEILRVPGTETGGNRQKGIAGPYGGRL